MSGLEVVGTIQKASPRSRVVLLTASESAEDLLAAVKAGASGYLTKDTPPDELLAQIRAVVDGGSPLTAGVASTVLDLLRHLEPAGTPGRDGTTPELALTEREREVLRCLMAGMAYKNVAARLDISIDTVRTHIRHIYGKLQVHSVAEAVTRALREGLV
jgi:DNA-binding NarL/FixJ family response regulator